MRRLSYDFIKGIYKENPVFRLVLGMCPILAVTTSAINGFAMGICATFVLVCANLVISSLRHLIPERVRIPVFIVVIATFVTIVDYFMKAYFYELHKVLGLFIPLIVVNCIILARAEAFASKHPIINSLADGAGMGAGFTLALIILGSIREILGNGTIFNIAVLPDTYLPFLVMILPPGAFIALGILLGIMNRLGERI